MIRHLIRGAIFDGCEAEFDPAEIVLIGAGYDGTSSYRTGSRFAPVAIRQETLYSQETYSPYFDRDLQECSVHDAGDLELPTANKTATLQIIEETAETLFQLQKTPCFIGGEHLITLPVIQAAHRHYPDMLLVQLDAHLDMIDELFGDRICHGTVMRRSLEILGSRDRIWQLGVRSGSQEEFRAARRHGQVFPFSLQPFLQAPPDLGDKPVYLTIDIDVFDPSLVPGTGTPEAGGIFFDSFVQFMKIAAKWNIIGMDLVELSPKIDNSGASTVVASKILREMLISVSP